MKTLDYRLKKIIKTYRNQNQIKTKSKTSTQDNVFQVNMKNIQKKKTQKYLSCCQTQNHPFGVLNFYFFFLILTNHNPIFIYVLIKTNNKKPKTMKYMHETLKSKIAAPLTSNQCIKFTS